MRRKTKLIAASIALCLSVGLSVVAAAGCGGGSYKMTDFVVNTAMVDLEYEVGETVDFSALEMYAMYSDSTKEDVAVDAVRFYLDGVDITDNLSKITESAGVKQITIKYERNHGKLEKTITIVVKEGEGETPVVINIDSYNKPKFLADYQASLANATNDKTAENFESVFFTSENNVYVVGDDNAFKFIPQASRIDFEADEEVILENFVADTTVWHVSGCVLMELEKRATAEKDVYEYYLGEDHYMTENAAKNEYRFETAALGQVLKISVLPDANVYDYDDSVTPISMEFKVVDGFNIYNEKELCVLDNSGRTIWDGIKGELGLLNVNPNAIVLHQNTLLTEDAVPSALKYTLADDYKVVYKDVATGKTGTPEDFGLTRTYLWNAYQGDIYALYDHTVSAGQEFAFYGNYFELDMSKMPLVAAFEPTGVSGDSEAYYGNDFSNTTFLHLSGQSGSTGDADENFSFYNLAVRGNAKAEQLVIDDETEGTQGDKLVYGGGLIFTKVRNMKASYDNVRTYTCFISLFADPNSEIHYNQTKCYDSFQNAIFIWGKANINVTNSFFKRAGGPVIIMNHVNPEKENPEERIPQLTVDENSEMEAYLTGSEVWFSVVQATTVVDSIKGMDALFNPLGKTILKDGALNIVALVMRDATDASAALNQIETQGKVTYKDAYIDRMDGSPFSTALKQILATGAPAFNVGTNLMYYNPTDPVNPAVFVNCDYTAFANPDAEHITLNMGGISIILGYNNLG